MNINNLGSLLNGILGPMNGGQMLTNEEEKLPAFNYKYKKMNESTVSSMAHMVSSCSEPKELVKSFCKEYQLNSEFVRRFYNLIDKESFSGSPKLTVDLIEEFNDLFDIEIWKNSNISLSLLRYSTYLDQLDTEKIIKILKHCDKGELEKDVLEVLLNINNNSLSEICLKRYLSSGIELDEDFVLRNLKHLTGAIFRIPSLDSFLTEDKMEELFRQKQPLDVEFFFAGLCKSKNYVWIEDMLQKAVDKKLAVEETGGTIDEYLGSILQKLPECYFTLLFEFLKEYAPNAISYKAIYYILTMKSPDEDFLIANYEYYISNGLKRKLADFAIENQYENLIMLLSLGD